MKAQEQELVQPTLGQERPGGWEQRVAQNVDFTNIDQVTGRNSALKRPGYEKIISLTGAHSGFYYDRDKFLCGSDLGICLVTPKNSSYEVIASLQNTKALISWVQHNGMFYWTNGEENGRIKLGANGPWGIERAGRPGISTSATGGMPAGKYQVVCIFLRGREEGGAGKGVPVTVAAGGGIQLTNIPQPQDATIDGIRIYITRQNTDAFQRYDDIAVGTTSLLITEKEKLGKRLETQFYDIPPVGHLITKREGDIAIAVRNILYICMPQRPWLFKRSEATFPFLEDITFLEGTGDGYYVSSDRLYFIKWDSKEEVYKDEMLPPGYEPIPGSAMSVPAHWFGIEKGRESDPLFWWTKRGFPVLGFEGGRIVPVGADKLSIPAYKIGATLLRERAGIMNIITAFNQNAPVSKFGATDSLSITLNKRGESS